jgi:hypothetical protein
MSGNPHERCCPPTELCPECLAYYAWLNRDLDPGTSKKTRGRQSSVAGSESEYHDRWPAVPTVGTHTPPAVGGP